MSAPIAPLGIAAFAAEVLEVDLVVLDPADREREVDLERAHVGVHLVAGVEIDVGEPAEDLVPLRDVALVEPVVGVDGRARDAFEVAERPLQLTGPNLDEGARHAPCLLGSSVSRNVAEHILPTRVDPSRRGAGMPYSVPDLPYDFGALEPHIDARTMEIHHDKHHQAYVDNANKALEGTEWADKAVEEVLESLDSLPEDKRTPVRNNAGGHANHTLFWEIMGPNGGGAPSGALAEAIDSTFGGFDAFKEQATQNGVTRFGSGWSWLVWNGSGLEAYSTANQDSPLMEGHTPLLGIDVWEHAYYLNYQNRRPDYLAAWWNVVNWDAVAARFESAR